MAKGAWDDEKGARTLGRGGRPQICQNLKPPQPVCGGLHSCVACIFQTLEIVGGAWLWLIGQCDLELSTCGVQGRDSKLQRPALNRNIQKEFL